MAAAERQRGCRGEAAPTVAAEKHDDVDDHRQHVADQLEQAVDGDAGGGRREAASGRRAPATARTGSPASSRQRQQRRRPRRRPGAPPRRARTPPARRPPPPSAASVRPAAQARRPTAPGRRSSPPARRRGTPRRRRRCRTTTPDRQHRRRRRAATDRLSLPRVILPPRGSQLAGEHLREQLADRHERRARAAASSSRGASRSRPTRNSQRPAPGAGRRSGIELPRMDVEHAGADVALEAPQTVAQQPRRQQRAAPSRSPPADARSGTAAGWRPALPRGRCGGGRGARADQLEPGRPVAGEDAGVVGVARLGRAARSASARRRGWRSTAPDSRAPARRRRPRAAGSERSTSARNSRHSCCAR